MEVSISVKGFLNRGRRQASYSTKTGLFSFFYFRDLSIPDDKFLNVLLNHSQSFLVCTLAV